MLLALAVVVGQVTLGGAPAPHVALLLDGVDDRDGGDGKATTPAPPAKARIDGVMLSFVPKVQVVTPGSTLTLRNLDEDAHTVHGRTRRHTLFNLATVPRGGEQQVLLPESGVVWITCELHEPMSGFVVVARTPNHAVTDEEGRFRIEGVAAGRYRVRAVWPRMRARIDALPATEEPGLVVSEVEITAAGEPLRTLAIALPAAPAEPRRPSALATTTPPTVETPPEPPPRWLTWLGERPTWPSGFAVYVFALLGLVLGLAAAIGNLRLGHARGWSRMSSVLMGCGLALASGGTVILGLHPGVSTALGFGVFIGTVVFGGGEEK